MDYALVKGKMHHIHFTGLSKGYSKSFDKIPVLTEDVIVFDPTGTRIETAEVHTRYINNIISIYDKTHVNKKNIVLLRLN